MNSKYKLKTILEDNEESWGNLAKETAGIRLEGNSQFKLTVPAGNGKKAL